MGIPISHDKLSRLISAEKRALSVREDEPEGAKLKRVI
jgi:hypothetical protein